MSPWQVVDQPPAGWTGGSGYITKEMLEKEMPEPLLGPLAKILICGPPGMVKHLAGELPSKKHGQGALGGLLQQMGYDASQVYKF